MRIKVLLLAFLIVSPLWGQGSGKHFSSALELGTGCGVPIDFKLDHRIFNLPWRAGLHIQRELDPTHYLEFGFELHRRNSSWASCLSDGELRNRVHQQFSCSVPELH